MTMTMTEDMAENMPESANTTKPVFTPPTYNMKEIYAAIPPHCLQPNTVISLFYILCDFFSCTLMSIATLIPLLPSPHLSFLAWAAYAFLQGLVFTGLRELAHECGHGALSKSKAFNSIAGLIIHSLLFVPFHSWRITHSTHHKSTNNLDKDIAFVPSTKEDWVKERKSHSTAWEYVEDMPIVALVHPFFHQFKFIAFLLYLTTNNPGLERMAAATWWQRSHFYLGGDGPNFNRCWAFDRSNGPLGNWKRIWIIEFHGVLWIPLSVDKKKRDITS